MVSTAAGKGGNGHSGMATLETMPSSSAMSRQLAIAGSLP